jgi:hypothetical protein
MFSFPMPVLIAACSSIKGKESRDAVRGCIAFVQLPAFGVALVEVADCQLWCADVQWVGGICAIM